MTWNQIVNAVYRNEWQLVENAVRALPGVRLDDANNLAEALGHIVGERLWRNQSECVVETVTWLARQPYINQQRFAEWVALDALKRPDSRVHQRTAEVVIPLCRGERLIEIALHLAECDEQRGHAAIRIAAEHVQPVNNSPKTTYVYRNGRGVVVVTSDPAPAAPGWGCTVQ